MSQNNVFDYFNKQANWSFDQYGIVSESLTDWDLIDLIKRFATPDSRILDLGTAGGEKVKVILGGDHKIYGVEIDPSVIDPEDAEGLSDLVMAAFNQAADELEAESQKRLNTITGGVKLPF